MKEEGKQIGRLLKPRREKAVPMEHADLPYIGLEHVEAHTTRLLGQASSSEMKSAANRFYAGDVLYSRLRPYLNKVWHADRDGLCSSEFIIMPKNDSVDGRFLCYRLNSADFVSFANSLNAGDRPRVDFDQISSFLLPPFSLSQQRRIVAEIEKQFSRLEEGVTALKRLQSNLKRYRAAVLKAACEGRLVPTEAELHKSGSGVSPLGKSRDSSSTLPYETGEQLLKRILEERRKNFMVAEASRLSAKGKKSRDGSSTGKYKEPTAPDTTNLPPLPEGWTWTGFEQLSDGTRNAIKAGPFGSSLKKSFYTPQGFKIYGQEQVIKDDAYFGDYFIPRELFEKLQSCEVKPGDILISLVGTTGKVLILPDDCAMGIINPRIVKFSLNRSAVNAKFIKFLLESATTRAFFKLAAHGGTMDVLNLSILKTLPVPLPPLAEQKRIVTEVERRLSVIDELESLVTTNLQRASRLRQAVLQKAFEGKLVV